jgi:hypothetical protein
MATESLECLLCHTAHVESFSGNPTRFWKCDRCGQHWDTERVAAVLNYKRWLKATMTVDHAA